MSHITIIINRVPPMTTSSQDEQDEGCTATVTYPVPHDATDEEVGKAVRKLYKQVRELGS